MISETEGRGGRLLHRLLPDSSQDLSAQFLLLHVGDLHVGKGSGESASLFLRPHPLSGPGLLHNINVHKLFWCIL